MNKKFFLTVDLEEWYHLLYFKKYTNFEGDDFFVPRIIEFLDYLDEVDVKATFFVLSELATKNKNIIADIHRRGHEIACHGLNHKLITNKRINDFKNELFQARDILTNIIGEDINGYRAPCFSLTNEALDVLPEIGFKYDSSYIKFSGHKLYNQLDVSSFERINSLQLVRENFYEFQIPTTKLNKLELPISGGGYLRILPWFLFKRLYIKELISRDSFQIFIHPFELYPGKFDLPIKVNIKDKLRFSFGRKGNLKKLKSLINLAKINGYGFYRMSDII